MKKERELLITFSVMRIFNNVKSLDGIVSYGNYDPDEMIDHIKHIASNILEQAEELEKLVDTSCIKGKKLTKS